MSKRGQTELLVLALLALLGLCGLIYTIYFSANPAQKQQQAVFDVPRAPSLSAQLTEEDAFKIGTDAYLFGYPLVTMYETERVMTNTVAPTQAHAPINQFANARRYPTASFHDVTAPNADTLYSIAWLDLRAEPIVLHVPDENGRYYLMPILDAWTNVFAVPGTRTTGTKEGNFLIAGPNWNGSLPNNLTLIRAPTTRVWIIGRTFSTGTPADYAAVNAIQANYTLTPLSAFGTNYSLPLGAKDNSIDMATPIRNQVNAMDAQEFFNTLAKALRDNPPSPADDAMMNELEAIGVTPGRFDASMISPAAARGFDAAVKTGQQQIIDELNSFGARENGWHIGTDLGSYGDNYLLRAATAFAGLGANLPSDAIYPVTTLDGSGRQLNGSNNYVLHFDKDKLPPVNGFWSLTMYNSAFFFVNNSLDRYNINPMRDNVKYNADGSLDIFVQASSPGAEKESNWLPAPNGAFTLMLRLYWPKDAVINGSWVPPPVQPNQ